MSDFEGLIDVPGGRLRAQWAGEGAPSCSSTRASPTRGCGTRSGTRSSRAPGRPVRHPRLRAADARRPVLEPRGPRRRAGRGGDRPRGVRRLLAGGTIVLDTALEYPDRVRARLGLRRRPGSTGRRRPRRRPRSSARRRSRRRRLGGAHRPRGAIWVDGIGQPAGRAPAFARDLVRKMTLETYAQEKECGAPIVPDPPAPAARRAPGAGARDRRAASTSRRRGSLPRCSWSGRGARRIDLPDVAHMPSLERPGVVHGDAAGVPRGGRRRRR